MGREKESKGEEKSKHKLSNLKNLSGYERAGAEGDVTKDSVVSIKSHEKNGEIRNKVKRESAQVDLNKKMKREPQEDDADFISKEKGQKRKRIKEEQTEYPTSRSKKTKTMKREEEDDTSQKKKSKKKTEKSVKEEDEPVRVSKKPKRTKEEVQEAKLLKIKKKEEEEQNRWRWWEEEKYEDGVKWKFLEHKGPYFPPEYQPLPDNVHFYYDGKPVKLSLAAEEVALFFAQMLDHEYTTKDVFRENFFKDWRKEMTSEERSLIKHLSKCDFGELHAMHKAKVEARKNMTKEEKLALKDANQKIVDEFGYCLLDHHKEKIGNFKIEPPGLFRGRGEHPKQGMLKKRIQPEDVIINCAKGSRVPEPPAGHRWKEIRHENTVTWLASWTENIQGSIKYIMLNANSKLKGEKDWEKYEIARKLKMCVEDIRYQYNLDLKSKQMNTRQRAVALYFIDKVFKNLKLFMENKDPEDDLFDRLNTQTLNKHLSSLMTGLTAKVFRTYNASITLQQQLKELTNKGDNVAEMILSYNRANRAVAILCNHQRAPPKTFEQSMANLQSKIDARKEQLALAKSELKQAKKEAKSKGNSDPKLQTWRIYPVRLRLVERKKVAVKRCEDQLLKMELQATDREENKQIALGTSKLNYLDPRISVAWCKKYGVPLEKIYNKSQRDKFAWAIDMTEEDFEF